MNQPKTAYAITLLFLLLAFVSALADDGGWLPINMRLWMLAFMALAAASGMATAVRFHTTATLQPRQYALLILVALTGMIHLFLGILGDWLLLANGLGFFALLCALYFPIDLLAPYRRRLPAILAVYTLITIVGYFVSHTPAAYDALGIGSKIIEVALLALLLRDVRGTTAVA